LFKFVVTSKTQLKHESYMRITCIYYIMYAVIVQKTAAADDKSGGTPTNQKMSDFRSKFEKFGGSPATGTVKPGTPAPFRRNSAAADVTASASTAGSVASQPSKDLLTDLQKQLSDAEKTRVKDRQELLDKLASQKKEFDAEVQEVKKKNKQVCSVVIACVCRCPLFLN